MPKQQLKTHNVNAEFQRSSFDAEKRTIEVICTTDAPVVRYGWDGNYNEVLSMDPKHVRLERFGSGAAPLLNAHSRYDLEDVIGVVERAWLEGNKLMAVVRFSDRESVKDIVKDVADGILKNLSIGYKVFKLEETTVESGQLPEFKAIEWEPYEVSFVPIPADPNAVVRAQEKSSNEVEIIYTKKVDLNIPAHKQDNPMTEEELKAQQAAAAAEKKRIEDEAMVLERSRAKSIRDAVKTFGLEDTIAESLIEKGISIDAARAEIQAEFAKKDPNQGASNVKVKKDEADTTREAIIAGMVLRSGEVKEKNLTDAEKTLGNQYRSNTLLDIAKESLAIKGIDVKGMDKMEIARRAMSSSSDFPVLLEGISRRVLLTNYQAVADVWREFCMIGSVSDFRDNKRLRMGSFSVLDKIGENSEYKNKKITDADSEKISASTVGNIINISRVMIVNDDLSGFTRLAAMLGRAAARNIEVDVFALLNANPVLSDGVALFHATHNNLIASGAAPSVAQFDAMRVLMASQKEKDGNDFLDLRPSIWLGPIGLGGDAKVVNGSQYDPDATNKLQRANKVNGLFAKVVDTARLTGTAYYAFADPSEEPVIEVAFLNGVQTPYMESEIPFNTDGVSWKIRMDYGVGAIGYRGVVKNAGV
jgi:hypothetical protein